VVRVWDDPAMRFHNRHFLASSALAVALISFGVMAASAASPVKITNCFKASSRPKTVTLTCGDGNTVLKGLAWSSYGGSTAQAKGTFVINLCEPNCAAGKAASYPVTAKASDPRNCKGGLRVYNKLTLTFPGRTPKAPGGLSRWTLGCPT
jgi:opacity protein-like surface antigen